MAESKPRYTDQQMKLLVAILREIDPVAPPTCDWGKIASEAGYTIGSAKKIWQNLKRDFRKEGGDGSAPTTPRKRKQVEPDDGTPKRGRPKKAIKAEADEPGVKDEPVDDGFDDALYAEKGQWTG